MAEKKRLNLAFSMASPLQREAWKRLCAVPSGQRTDAVCRAVCRAHEQDALLIAVRSTIREELRNAEFISKTEKSEQPEARDTVDENVLSFLTSLQNDDSFLGGVT